MDFTQSKLSKLEWDTIEKPVSENEKKILQMITRGYSEPNIIINNNLSLFQYVKTEKTIEIEYNLYMSYFDEAIKKVLSKYGQKGGLNNFIISHPNSGKELKTLRSSDVIRLEHLQKTIEKNREKIFEFLLVELGCNLVKQYSKNNTKYVYYYYTLLQLLKINIKDVNTYVLQFTNYLITKVKDSIDIEDIIGKAYELIETNKHLLKYENKTLFTHQKQLFQLFQHETETFQPKLVLYTAPTGTGKTMTPLGLSEKYRIIFVCVARHIGLALAKSGISVNKKVAFGFGCSTASDIRLHYFAAKDYEKDWFSGGIRRVNNSVGDNVEIMICDVQSYITCMHYMLAFNKAENIITFWDEPTITLDYETHPLHEVIHNNWKHNLIPNMVLSCATLPDVQEMNGILSDFQDKFMDYENMADIFHISSYDCKKSISLLNKDGYNELPHYLFENNSDLKTCASYCESNKSLLRYMDLQEIIKFILFIEEYGLVVDEYDIEHYFEDEVTNVTMNNLKLYYLLLLKKISSEDYEKVYKYFQNTRKKKFDADTMRLQKVKSFENPKTKYTGEPIKRVSSVFQNVQPNKNHNSTGISLTTSDAYTLTDGPTLFLTEDIEKIGNFYIQHTNIPNEVFTKIIAKISKNNELAEEIEKLEKQILAEEKSKEKSDTDDGKSKGKDRDNIGKLSKEAYEAQRQINILRKKIYSVSLDACYLPNSISHQKLWTPDGDIYESAFISNIGEEMTKKIMALPVQNYCKVLLLLGIGMFSSDNNKDYLEVIKILAEEQRLFIIIASSDYIYGTNYQFCHGFLSKDLTKMTQQKIIQAIGRVGRNNIQQEYTVRFRDNNMIKKIFTQQEENIEADHLRNLFSSD